MIMDLDMSLCAILDDLEGTSGAIDYALSSPANGDGDGSIAVTLSSASARAPPLRLLVAQAL